MSKPVVWSNRIKEQFLDLHITSLEEENWGRWTYRKAGSIAAGEFVYWSCNYHGVLFETRYPSMFWFTSATVQVEEAEQGKIYFSPFSDVARRLRRMLERKRKDRVKSDRRTLEDSYRDAKEKTEQ
jgi:hypothetical protein